MICSGTERYTPDGWCILQFDKSIHTEERACFSTSSTVYLIRQKESELRKVSTAATVTGKLQRRDIFRAR